MGWTNSVPIFHDDITCILQPEIPNITVLYIDNVPIRGPAEHYVLADGTEECIPENLASAASCGSTSKGSTMLYSAPSIVVARLVARKRCYVWRRSWL